MHNLVLLFQLQLNLSETIKRIHTRLPFFGFRCGNLVPLLQTLLWRDMKRLELNFYALLQLMYYHGMGSLVPGEMQKLSALQKSFFFCQIFVHTHCTCGVGTKLLNPFFIYQGVNCVDYFHGGEKPYLISGADDRLVKIWDYQVSLFLTFCGLIL